MLMLARIFFVVVCGKMDGCCLLSDAEDLAEGRWRPWVSVLLQYRAAALKQKALPLSPSPLSLSLFLFLQPPPCLDGYANNQTVTLLMHTIMP